MSNPLELPLTEKDQLEKQAQQVERASLDQRIRDAQPVTDQPGDIQFIDLKRINANEIQSPADFKSSEQYAGQLREAQMLKQMMPYLEQGANPEMFEQWDKANQIGHYSPDTYVRGYTDVYKSYYGDEKIGLELKPNGTYDALNGRHRIYVARAAGLEKIPAQVVE